LHSALLKIKYESSEIAEALYRAVEPDNVDLPSGLKIKVIKRENSILFYIECEGKIGRLLQTLDDLLACIQAAERSIVSAQQRYK